MPGSDLLLSAVAQSDDKLLVVGTGTNEGLQQMEVPRLTADGAFDPTWSGDGIAWVSAGNPAQGGGVAVGPDTKVLVAGGTQDSGTLGMLIGRLHGDTTTPVVTPTPTAVATATPTPTSTPPKAVSPLDRFTLAKPTLRKLLGRKLKATAHCARACSLTLTLKASSSEARKRKLGRGAQVVAKGSARITKAGTLSVKLVAASRLRRKLARLHALTTTATLAVTDSTHSRFTSTRKIAFKH